MTMMKQFGFLALLLLSQSTRVRCGDFENDDDYFDKDEDEEEEEEWGSNLEPHPDPNHEHYEGMVYIGMLDTDGKRVGFEHDNTVRYIFGTSFDESHKEIEEKDLHYHHRSSIHDLPQKTREQVLLERRHKKVDKEGPKPFGHVDVHELDGGVKPPKVVSVDPFFMDTTLVTNKQFGQFVRKTHFQTEAEKYGWSFVLSSFVSKQTKIENDTSVQRDPEAEHWVTIDRAYWKQPEGPGSSYKYREHHPVVHVSHRDAAEYCAWVGKRLPGEWEWEAAARAGYWGPNNRTLYNWGDAEDLWLNHSNLWGTGEFPFENHAEDGWRGTSPVKTFPPNAMGFYDMIGNVWEWMRGGKHKARIVRGGSYVDTVDGSTNHAATLGARDTLHGTTTTGNVGFRCVKSPKRRTEHHYVYHDEQIQGQLAIEDQYGKQDHVPQRGWEDQSSWREDPNEKRKKKKVVKQRARISTEL